MSRDGAALLQEFRAALAALGRPKKAREMQAYLKSAEPLHGVSLPEVRRTCRSLLAGVTFAGPEAWRAAVLAVWRGAKFREERYAALALAAAKQARPFQTLEALPLYEELIVTGAWWDLVDEVAVQRLPALLAAAPVELRRAMREWSRCDDVWKRRASILCQVKARGDADLALLWDCIEPSLEAEGEKRVFWERKAIGWALRELARYRPAEVRRYVREHEARLSGLSKREAAKGLARTLSPRQRGEGRGEGRSRRSQ